MANFWMYLSVGLGGAIGAMGRTAVSRFTAGVFGEWFPVGTMIANVSGCVLIGVLAVLVGPDGRIAASPNVRAFLLLGVLGGYTTFSSFSLQTLNLCEEGQWGAAAMNVALSVLLCLLGVWLGSVVGNVLNVSR